MNDPREWAISYLAARGDVPWRWADDGDVITWADGTTIAFREEVAFVLEWLVPHGWPAFGALVWLLAASRGKLPPRVSSERQFVLSQGSPGAATADPAQMTLDGFHERLRSMHAAVEDGLAMVASLPSEMRTKPKAKAVLAEMIFGDRPGDRGNASLRSAVVEVLRSGMLTDTMLNDPGAPPTQPRNEWLALHDGLKGVTPAAIALRLRTGLDALPQAAELPEISSVRVRALLEELRTDAEHAGLARLARDFMAALQLPRRLSEQDEMPIGGFADLANRGDLDRLLLSELAHDDLTLAVRIALNEALYLRREPPAKQPPSTLAVLIDSGVRLWGVPRLLAAAIALALIAKSARHETPSVFRASGSELKPVDLLTREGLTAHLEVLEPQVHPGLALAAFSQRVQTEERAEAVVITHRDVLSDADFQRQLAEAGFETLYLAVVDREGRFELLRYPRGGPPVCQAQVDVDNLWPPPAPVAPRRAPLVDRSANLDLPASLLRQQFPLLLSVRGRVQASVETANGGGLCIMQDRRMLQWDRAGRGARTLAWSLPRGQTLWLGEQANGRICVVKAHGGCREVFCRVFLPNGDLVISYDWRFGESVRRVDVEGDLVFLIGGRNAAIRSLSTGQELGRLPVSRRVHGRYFRSADGRWSVLAWNGMALELVPVTLPTGVPTGTILRLFHRQGHEGPWCVTHDGCIYSSEGRRVLQICPLRGVVHVSENGHRLLVVELSTGISRLVDLPSGEHWAIAGTLGNKDWGGEPTPPSHGVRVRFDRIAITDDEAPHLRTPGGQWWMILPGSKGVLILPESTFGYPDAVAFEPIRIQGQLGFSLKIARWPDGRRAWLDDRGMLHLRGADTAIPEVTLVLSEPVCGWASNGKYLAHPFFVSHETSDDLPVFWQHVQECCRPKPLFPRIRP